METVADPSSFKEALIILGAAAVVIPLFHRLRLSPVLGFMLVGAAVGPFGLGRLTRSAPWLSPFTLDDPAVIAPVAGFGVVLLMFTIGLELSLERLWATRRLVFGVGGLQVAASAAGLAGAGLAAGLDAVAAAVLGVAGAMSSTAVALQVLAEEKRLASDVGRLGFAVLLFQDLTVLPVLFALDLRAPGAHEGGLGHLGLAVAQSVLAVAAVIGAGRLALRPLFRGVAHTRSPELFMAACLLVVLATALATAAAGLSPTSGALVSGVLLAGTEFRRQVEATVEPFKGLLVGVFLISIGMGLDLGQVLADPLVILGGALGLVLVKLAVVAVLARLFGVGWPIGVQAGFLLGPGGEFGFVILSVAVAEKLLPPGLAGSALIATALTMACLPLLSRLGQRVTRRGEADAPVDPALLPPAGEGGGPRVILAGFGRVGQTVAAMLDVHAVPFVAVDRDVARVAAARAAGRPVYFGDTARVELLRTLDLAGAQALVVTMDDPQAVDEAVAAARAERPDLLIVARARDAGHAAHLYRIGASDAVPETIEASLQLSEAVLVDLGIAMGPVIASIHGKRAEFQAGIKAMAPEADVRPIGRRRWPSGARGGSPAATPGTASPLPRRRG